jgi:hypothetical protein
MKAIFSLMVIFSASLSVASENFLCGVDIMNEDCYLNSNLDLKAAKENGTLTDSCEHFLLFGKKEGRTPYCADGGPVVLPSPIPTPLETPTPLPTFPSSPDRVSVFEFSYPRTGDSYPDRPSGNGYVQVSFPSHSIVSTQVAHTPSDVDVSCEYELIRESGERVLYVKDTIGGLHPNFFSDEVRSDPRFSWVNQMAGVFIPFGPFSGFVDRGNNHRDAYTQYVPEGRYTWVVRNIGNAIQHLRAGLIREGNGTNQVDEELYPNQEFRRTLHIYPNRDDAYDSFKLNLNNYRLK